jgi:hypothetical protein
MITFKTFLAESTEVSTMTMRPLSKVEAHMAERFQELCIAIHDALKTKHNITIEQANTLLEALKRFPEFSSLLSYPIHHIEQVLAAHGKMLSAAQNLKLSAPNIKAHAADLEAAFLSGDLDKADTYASHLKSALADLDHHVNAPERISSLLSNIFTNKPSIFATVGLLTYLGDDEYDAVRKLNFDEQLYTSVDFPLRKLKSNSISDMHYLMYFMLQLKNDAKPVRIKDDSDFRQHVRVKHANDGKLEELLELTDRYLHGNDKSLIPRIVKLINSTPAIKQANDRAKRKIKTVYRGLGVDSEVDKKTAVKRDRKTRYVATSPSRFAARNFALQKGHLEHDDMRRSEVGYIIEYAVTPEAILFDTRVIDTTFNESEILIDAAKATVVKVHKL